MSLRNIVLICGLVLCAQSLHAQSEGFLRFSGTIAAAEETGNLYRIQVQVYNATMNVVLDEHATVTGSLGGRVSARGLVPGLFVEVAGWMGSDGVLRASDVEVKVQSGALRMSSRVERIFQRDDATSILVGGIEFRVDSRSAVVSTRNGLAVSGTITDLKVDDPVDITATYINETGVGPSTSGLFHADRIVTLRTFRIQGPIRARTPTEGQPTVVVVQGIVVTITPETTVAGNGMNDRSEAFLTQNPTLISGIEDDAGNPCTEPGRGCPDSPPQNPQAAGDLRVGGFVRIEGVIEDTGFSSRYTARSVQVEKPDQIRLQGTVVSRSAEVLVVKINDASQLQVRLDSATQFQGDVAAGRRVEVSARLNEDSTMVGRRIKQVP